MVGALRLRLIEEKLTSLLTSTVAWKERRLVYWGLSGRDPWLRLVEDKINLSQAEEERRRLV